MPLWGKEGFVLLSNPKKNDLKTFLLTIATHPPITITRYQPMLLKTIEQNKQLFQFPITIIPYQSRTPPTTTIELIIACEGIFFFKLKTRLYILLKSSLIGWFHMCTTTMGIPHLLRIPNRITTILNHHNSSPQTIPLFKFKWDHTPIIQHASKRIGIRSKVGFGREICSIQRKRSSQSI